MGLEQVTKSKTLQVMTVMMMMMTGQEQQLTL
jgi:hypothetical protein